MSDKRRTAAHWSQTILAWQPGYEPAAYGLAVALLRLNDKAGAAEVIRAWQDRSAGIGALLKRKQSERDVRWPRSRPTSRRRRRRPSTGQRICRPGALLPRPAT